MPDTRLLGVVAPAGDATGLVARGAGDLPHTRLLGVVTPSGGPTGLVRRRPEDPKHVRLLGDGVLTAGSAAETCAATTAPTTCSSASPGAFVHPAFSATFRNASLSAAVNLLHNLRRRNASAYPGVPDTSTGTAAC